jgi:hypothetical protein
MAKKRRGILEAIKQVIRPTTFEFDNSPSPEEFAERLRTGDRAYLIRSAVHVSLKEKGKIAASEITDTCLNYGISSRELEVAVEGLHIERTWDADGKCFWELLEDN